MLDQVAIAPCTDPIQVRFLTFEAKPLHFQIVMNRPAGQLAQSLNLVRKETGALRRIEQLHSFFVRA